MKDKNNIPKFGITFILLSCFIMLCISSYAKTETIANIEEQFVNTITASVSNELNTQVENNQVVYLSDIKYKSAKVGWGSLLMDKTSSNTQITLMLNGNQAIFKKGIWAHATSEIVYDVTGYKDNYAYLTTYYGVNTTSGNRGNGVKFFVQTSIDGKTWTDVTDPSPKALMSSNNAGFVKVDIRDINYVKLLANDNGSNGNDHAVWADSKLIKEGYNDNVTMTVEEYDSLIKEKYSNAEIDDELELLILQRELVNNAGQYTLRTFCEESEQNVDTFNWLFNNLENLRLYVLGGKPDGGSYYNSLTQLSRLYTKYKEDFKDKTLTNNKWYPNLTKGDVYKKMVISLSLTHSTAVGYWAQIDNPSNRSDALERYRIYKYLYDNGKFVVSSRQDHTPWFEALQVEEMRYIMNNITDDEELIWLNEYTQKRIDAHPNQEEKYLQPHIYIAYVWPNFQNPIFHDPLMKDYWDEKFEGIFSKYGVTYSSEGNMVYKAWMSMRNEFGTGAVCGGISKLGTHIRAAHGTPASVISQPGHAAIIYYRKDANGNGYWSMDNGINGWGQSGKTEKLGTRMPLGWGSDSYVSGWAASYIVLAQEALNHNDDYEKSEKLIMLANVYNDEPTKKEQLLREALEVLPYNVDAWWELIKLYQANTETTEAQYFELAKEMSEALKAFPLPMYNLSNLLKNNLNSAEYSFAFSLLQTRILTEGKNATAQTVNVYQPGVTKDVASFLLGQMDTTLASFSFDGENAKKIVLSNRFDGSGVRWDYSLDGKKTWKEVSFSAEEEHKWLLTPDEISSITAENDIYVHIVGANYNEENLYKIDIKESIGLPSTLYANDWEDKLMDASSIMMWKLNDDDSWHLYGEEEPDLSGDKTLKVKMAATGVYLEQKDSVTFNFTADNNPDTKKYIPISHLSIEGYSTQSKDSGRPFYAPNAIDGNRNTIWHTDFAVSIVGSSAFITIKLDEPRYLSALDFVQKKYKSNDPCYIKNAIVYVSDNGNDWIEVGRKENCPQNEEFKTIEFSEIISGRYVKIQLIGYDMFASLSMVNLYEDTTIQKVADFSFDGENANKLILIDKFKGQPWEFSLDGGQNWKAVSGDEYLLNEPEIEEIDESNDIKLRINNIEYVIDIKKSAIPTISAYLNDLENRLIGITNTDILEWKIENNSGNDSDWKDYSEEEPVVKGNAKLLIRTKARNVFVASDTLEYEFVENDTVATKYVPIKHLSVEGFSSENVRANRGEYEYAINSIDANINTMWHTSRVATNDQRYIIIKLDEPKYISKIQYVKKAGYTYGVPKNGIISTSMDGQNWEEAVAFENLYNPTNKEELIAMENQKDIAFAESKEALYVKIQCTKSCDYVNGNKNGVPYDYFIAATMFNLFEDMTKNTTPTAEIEYSTTELTNNNVVATLVNPSTNITITNNGGSNKYTFTENGRFTFEFVDESGNVGTTEAVVDWIDKQAIVPTIAYNINQKTNQDVTATIVFNKQNVTVEGGSTHTFTKNGSYTFNFEDEAGNTGTAVANVDWIDKEAPTPTITYSTQNPTNQDVVATITFNEQNVTVKDGNTHTFTDNANYMFEFEDEAGNKGTAEAIVTWIDRTIPRATVTYNINTPTNQDVIATVTFDKENVTVKGGNTHTFTKNGSYTFEFVGPAGNTGSVTATVDWIDKKVPVPTITYSTEHPTNQNVVATITFDKENVTVKGGNTHTFTDNGSYTFEFVGPSGNKGRATARVDWIDRTLPKATITYDINTLTNKDVVATVTFDKENVTVKGGNTHTFTQNGEYEFEFVGPAGNAGTIIAKVDWIDKTAPIATVKYSTITTTNKDVVATVTFDKENVTVKGGNTHTFTDNGEYIFEFEDEAGNKGTAVAIVSWIERIVPKVEVQYSTTSITKENVIVTLKFDKEVTILNEDIYIEKYENNVYKMRFVDNAEFVIEFVDNLGNKGSQKIKVDWIDTVLPTAQVQFNTTEPTKDDVIANVIFSEDVIILNEDLDIEGVFKDIYAIRFTKNDKYTINFVDLAGNKNSQVIDINWIDRDAPTAELEYNIKESTTSPVRVTLKPSEEVTILNNDGKDTYVFDDNGEFTFEFEDKAGNRGTATAKVVWIKKVSGLEFVFSTKESTNEDVEVTLVSENRNITIDNNNGSNTYVFTENGEFTFEYTDEYGRKGNMTAYVDWIDKLAPIVEIEYSKTTLTNQNITVTLKFSEEVTILNEDLEFTKNEDGTYTVVFEENAKHCLEFEDKAGNKGKESINIDYIDKEVPTAQIEYSRKDVSTDPVTVTLIPSEKVKILNNNGSDKYTFTENGTFTFEFEDEAGNKGNTTVNVNWIGEPTKVSLKYNIDKLTNKDVIVTLLTEDGEQIDITNNSGSNVYTFKQNGTFTFEYVDKYGIVRNVTANVNWIDKTIPNAEISYNTTETTNGNVIATITFDEEVEIITKDVEIEKLDSNIYKVKFEDNDEIEIEFKDKAGNIGKTILKVDWIQILPNISISYDITTETKGNVTATITADDIITITNNDGKNTYTFSDNGEFTFEYLDKYGNEGKAIAKVNWIVKEQVKPIEPTKPSEDKEDIISVKHNQINENSSIMSNQTYLIEDFTKVANASVKQENNLSESEYNYSSGNISISVSTKQDIKNATLSNKKLNINKEFSKVVGKLSEYLELYLENDKGRIDLEASSIDIRFKLDSSKVFTGIYEVKEDNTLEKIEYEYIDEDSIVINTDKLGKYILSYDEKQDEIQQEVGIDTSNRNQINKYIIIAISIIIILIILLIIVIKKRQDRDE